MTQSILRQSALLAPAIALAGLMAASMPGAAQAQVKAAAVASPAVSNAATPEEYRKDAAAHIYAANKTRIYKGKLPPLLPGVGVLQVQIDDQGAVKSVNWMRAPSNGPEVMAEIEKIVRAAAPFPAPAKMGGVTYTDTWLWDKSGRFQLHTLSEGQL